jgi:hypothetical protein
MRSPDAVANGDQHCQLYERARTATLVRWVADRGTGVAELSHARPACVSTRDALDPVW